MKFIHWPKLLRAVPISRAVFLEEYSTGDVKVNPTLATGDVKIRKENGTAANLATLPDVEPDSTEEVRVQLSESELDAEYGSIVFRDQTAEKEWEDFLITWTTEKTPTGKVVTDAGNSTTQIKVQLFGMGTEANDYVKKGYITFIDGALKGQVAKVLSYTASTDILVLVTADAFTGVPADGTRFIFVSGL